MREPRRYPRNPTASLVSYTRRSEDGGVVDQGMATLMEMSLAGMSIGSARALPEGSLLDLEVQVRNDLVRVTGRVVRVTTPDEDAPDDEPPFRIGLSIERASPNYADVLREYFA